MPRSRIRGSIDRSKTGLRLRSALPTVEQSQCELLSRLPSVEFGEFAPVDRGTPPPKSTLAPRNPFEPQGGEVTVVREHVIDVPFPHVDGAHVVGERDLVVLVPLEPLPCAIEAAG